MTLSYVANPRAGHSNAGNQPPLLRDTCNVNAHCDPNINQELLYLQLLPLLVVNLVVLLTPLLLRHLHIVVATLSKHCIMTLEISSTGHVLAEEPREIAVIYIPAHTKSLDSFAHGNALADSAARAAAVHDVSPATTVVATLLPFPVGPALYDELDEEELNKWKCWEATQQDGIWKLGDKPLLPMRYFLSAVSTGRNLARAIGTRIILQPAVVDECLLFCT
ncbi:hypothetical protein Q9233_003095 [Columba guinea]|nr:hypothetical protein Q9233_003095 [Columba guinea]